MSKVKDENYYQISGWMLNKLKLKGTELNVYAIIYGFTQDGETEFKGSRQYLSDFTGTSRPTIDKALQELCDKNLIIKTTEISKGIIFNSYKINYNTLENFTGCKEILQGGCKETLQGRCKETLHNNIDIDKNNNDNKDNIYISTTINRDGTQMGQSPALEKEIKHRYGEYNHVLLTDKQYNKLAEDYGESKTLEAIKYLDEYIQMKGYKCKDYNLAMRKWVFDAISKNKKDRTMDILNELYEEAGRETEDEGGDFIWNYQSKM